MTVARQPQLFCPVCAARTPPLRWAMDQTFIPCPEPPVSQHDDYRDRDGSPQWRYRCGRCDFQEVYVSQWWEGPR